MLFLTDWIKAAFEAPFRGMHFLGGFRADTDLSSAKQMLQEFWDRYCLADPTVPKPTCPQRTFPMYIHGDEGRGLVKKPLMVISYQPCISWKGGDSTNSTGTFT